MDICVVGKQDALLATELATRLNAPLYTFSHDYFADTESIMRFTHGADVANKLVLIVYQFLPSNREAGGDRYTCVNHQFLDILFLVQRLKQHQPAGMILVLPYLPYARQEKKDDCCAASPFELALSLLAHVGVRSVVATDIHGGAAGVQGIQEVCLDSQWVQFLQEYCHKQNITFDQVAILSPDQGGLSRARAVATALGTDFACMYKHRPEKNRVVMQGLVGNVAGKTVIIIDDILDTARTAVLACEIARDYGADRVIGCFSHAVLSAGSLKRLEESCFDAVFLSSTMMIDTAHLPSMVHIVPVESYLVEQIEIFIHQMMRKEPSCKLSLINQ
ncbi:ribose-phosphate pyrophosphokinase [Candidatus Dependentiae bacterium]|jgi:ribose-phosphate pyrophosphokinase|nr:ribose-phosphate pyrophosphokinase [Candidatus Dependentiae bacterium]